MCEALFNWITHKKHNVLGPLTRLKMTKNNTEPRYTKAYPHLVCMYMVWLVLSGGVWWYFLELSALSLKMTVGLERRQSEPLPGVQ